MQPQFLSILKLNNLNRNLDKKTFIFLYFFKRNSSLFICGYGCHVEMMSALACRLWAPATKSASRPSQIGQKVSQNMKNHVATLFGRRAHVRSRAALASLLAKLLTGCLTCRGAVQEQLIQGFVNRKENTPDKWSSCNVFKKNGQNNVRKFKFGRILES